MREPKGGYAWNADHVTAVYQVQRDCQKYCFLSLWLFGGGGGGGYVIFLLLSGLLLFGVFSSD